MKRYLIFSIIFLSFSAIAQDNRIPLDTSIVTLNSVVIKGKTIPYKATTGMQPFGTAMVKLLPLYTIPIIKELMLKIPLKDR